MGFPGYSGWTVQLDPSAVATNRTTLDINTGPIQIGSTGGGVGVDWGTSQITEFLAQEAIWGSTVVDYVVPNRTITIPLIVQDWGATSFETASQQLREKVALFQREGGWLVRQTGEGAPMYADVVDAQLVFPDVYGETGDLEPDVTLTLVCLPDFYGAEVTLDSASVTGVYSGVLQQSSAQATVTGDHPGRCRILVTDTSGNNQNGVIWGWRAQHYDNASTAALVYQAEALTPVNGATVVTGVAGAVSGSAVEATNLPVTTWASFLTNEISSGSAQMTHQGTYQVWARAFSSNGTPQLRLLWAVGSLAVPVTNNPVALPNLGSFYLLNLGTIRLDAPPVGTNEWFGVIQAFSSNVLGNDNVTVDEILFQPLDEGGGELTYELVTPASLSSTTMLPQTGIDDSSIGTSAWTNPNNIATPGLSTTSSVPATGISHYLDSENFGFGVPGGATVVGISVTVTHGSSPNVVDNRVSLIKAGSVQATNRASGIGWTSATVTYGGPSDLWGGTWSPSDVNASNFGVAISAKNSALVSRNATLSNLSITIYYTLGAGFSVSQDAVVYASQTSELRTEGMFRTPGSAVYGPIANVIGDLPRVPPSGLETRAVQLFVKPTRGDLSVLADSGIDGMTVRVIYRPTYLFRP